MARFVESGEVVWFWAARDISWFHYLTFGYIPPQYNNASLQLSDLLSWRVPMTVRSPGQDARVLRLLRRDNGETERSHDWGLAGGWSRYVTLCHAGTVLCHTSQNPSSTIVMLPLCWFWELLGRSHGREANVVSSSYDELYLLSVSESQLRYVNAAGRIWPLDGGHMSEVWQANCPVAGAGSRYSVGPAAAAGAEQWFPTFSYYEASGGCVWRRARLMR